MTFNFKNDMMNIVTRNLQECIGTEKLDQCIDKNKNFNLYWGTAPTGRPHIAYFVPMTKIADFLRAGCSVTILFADLHAYLDNMKAPWELLQKRTEYYEILIKGMLKALFVPLDKLRFVRGTEYQLNENYTANVYKIIGITSTHDATKAGCDVVKQISDPLISGIIYPLLQALDEEFLNADAQFGGVDQRKIFMYAEKCLGHLGFAKRAHLMNPMIPGLTGGKMSASEENSKIDLLDTADSVSYKLSTANCTELSSSTNGILAFIKFVILPVKSQLNIDLLKKYNTIEEIELDFNNKLLDENSLKSMVETALRSLMGNLKEEFIKSGKENLDQEAYPIETEKIDQNPPTELANTISGYQNNLKSLLEEFPQALSISLDTFPDIPGSPKILWSVRATGEPHIGYLLPLRKLANLSHRSWKITILIEDIGAHLFSQHSLNKPAWNLIRQRGQLYKQFISSALTNYQADLSNIEFIFGSDYQLSREYALLLYQSFSHVTERDCSEMLLQMIGQHPNSSDIRGNLSSLVYPCLSVLDQLILKPTVRLVADYSYIDRFRDFAAKLSARLHFPKSNPVYIRHETILALNGLTAMKSPKIDTKAAPTDTISISMCDSADTIARKLKKAFFDPKSLDRDPSLNILEHLIWPSFRDSERFLVKRTNENGGDVKYSSVDQIRVDLVGDLLHPGDVKSALVEYLNERFIQPIKSLLGKDLEQLLLLAFPLEQKHKFKHDKDAFNPNSLNIRVARIVSIEYVDRTYQIQLRSGLEEFLVRRSQIGSWTPNDLCLLVVKPSTNIDHSRALGMLHRVANGDGGDCSNALPLPLKLVKLQPYNDNVSFENHEIICPHLKENDENVIASQIATGLAVVNGSLQWKIDGSLARDIELIGDGACQKIVIG